MLTVAAATACGNGYARHGTVASYIPPPLTAAVPTSAAPGTVMQPAYDPQSAMTGLIGGWISGNRVGVAPVAQPAAADALFARTFRLPAPTGGPCTTNTTTSHCTYTWDGKPLRLDAVRRVDGTWEVSAVAFG
jgi:hypothetical protein